LCFGMQVAQYKSQGSRFRHRSESPEKVRSLTGIAITVGKGGFQTAKAGSIVLIEIEIVVTEP
ncbi:hypothetical protein X777_14960, partial [Ooceraea biroi]